MGLADNIYEYTKCRTSSDHFPLSPILSTLTGRSQAGGGGVSFSHILLPEIVVLNRDGHELTHEPDFAMNQGQFVNLSSPDHVSHEPPWFFLQTSQTMN